ncbi:MAG: GH32 C-terminal domain-containing protein [Francisella endosymbiont of Hyalomma asiaticum]
MPQAFIKDITSQHISVDIFLDTTSIELFVNNDEESITMRFEASQTLKNILKIKAHDQNNPAINL